MLSRNLLSRTLAASSRRHAAAAATSLSSSSSSSTSTQWQSKRHMSMLKARLDELIPEKREALAKMNKELGSKVIGECTVGAAIGGMRGLPAMLWETSLLDANDGIRFRGHSIPELQATLPTGPEAKAEEPLPEGLLWLLMTGEMPTATQQQWLTAELHRRAAVPAHVEAMIRGFPRGMHPMTQFSTAVLACQVNLTFSSVDSVWCNW
jgi:citrate synthase